MSAARRGPQFIRERFSVVVQHMVLKLRQPCIEFEDTAPDREHIMASHSFGQPVPTCRELRERVSTYVTRAGEKMRRQRLATAHVVVFVNANRLNVEDTQY